MLNCSFKSIRVDCFCSSVVSVVVMMAVVGRGGVGVWGGVGVDCFLLLLREAWILVVVLKCRYVMCPCMHHQPSSALQPCEWPDTRILSSLSFFFPSFFIFNEFRDSGFCICSCLFWWPVWYPSNEPEVCSDTGASDICACVSVFSSELSGVEGGVTEVVPGQAGRAGLKFQALPLKVVSALSSSN